MAQDNAGWSPPKEVQDLLIANIPDGTQWFELRMKLKTISYTIDRYDEALQDTRALERVFGAALFYCCMEDGQMTAEKVW